MSRRHSRGPQRTDYNEGRERTAPDSKVFAGGECVTGPATAIRAHWPRAGPWPRA
jgi:NADPH-dependent glutamate synthase beta subunit-like oxidoreductase